jgi:hypothetical protein
MLRSLSVHKLCVACTQLFRFQMSLMVLLSTWYASASTTATFCAVAPRKAASCPPSCPVPGLPGRSL